MPLPKLELQIVRSPFSSGEASSNDARDVAGGLPILRADATNVRGRCKVTWELSPTQYNDLITFVDETISGGASPFLIDVAFDYSFAEEREVKLVPGTLALVGIDGHRFTVGAELEVVTAPNDELDDSLLDLFETYGDVDWRFESLFLSLYELVNIKLPEGMEA